MPRGEALATRPAATAAEALWSPRSTAEIAPLLSGRRWLRRTRPFPHLVADELFRPDVHAALEARFLADLHPGGPGTPPSGFARTMKGYDATGLHFHPRMTGPMRLFVSRGFRDLVAGAVGVEVTRHVSGGLHHHAVGSASGTLHSDLNPAWFVEYDSPDGMVVVDHRAVRYRTGELRASTVRPRPFVRGVAVLYYLANPPWRRGDGGTTGLYSTADARVAEPEVAVPPRNNTLVAFEVTPHSYHAFISNRRSPRNSLAMWLHRPRAAVLAQWGDGVIENDSPE